MFQYKSKMLYCLTLIVFLLMNGCDRSTSIFESSLTPAEEPPYELEPVAEPPVKTSPCVVLSHSRYRYYSLAQEIQSYYDGALLHINDNNQEQLVEKLKLIKPQNAIIVLPPNIIKEEVVSDLFLAFCSLDNDYYIDIGYGYITGYTLEDAYDLFTRSKVDTSAIGSYLAVSHVFEGDEWCRSAIDQYKLDFSRHDWESYTIVVEGDHWLADRSAEMMKFKQNQIIFFIGHGSENSSCGIHTNDLDSVSLSGNIIFSGTCYTGAISSPYPSTDFIALKILHQGANFYISNVDGNGWANVVFIAAGICEQGMSFGEAIVAGINREINFYNLKSFDDMNDIKHIISFGDPFYKPKLKSKVDLYFP